LSWKYFSDDKDALSHSMNQKRWGIWQGSGCSGPLQPRVGLHMTSDHSQEQILHLEDSFHKVPELILEVLCQGGQEEVVGPGTYLQGWMLQVWTYSLLR